MIVDSRVLHASNVGLGYQAMGEERVKRWCGREVRSNDGGTFERAEREGGSNCVQEDREPVEFWDGESDRGIVDRGHFLKVKNRPAHHVYVSSNQVW